MLQQIHSAEQHQVVVRLAIQLAACSTVLIHSDHSDACMPLQGGDPTGTGTGGESIYGPTFKDELDSRLLHSGRGVLSMANSGANTNGSQFFILYKSAAHLNYKHSVFGRVVGGLDVLSLMEKVVTDDEDRPLQVWNCIEVVYVVLSSYGSSVAL